MTTVTIPKELAKKGDLVLVPRKEYEAFLGWRKAVRPAKKKKQTALDRALQEALAEVERGEVGPAFDSAEELVRYIESKA